jgi:hypothetical protein
MWDIKKYWAMSRNRTQHLLVPIWVGLPSEYKFRCVLGWEYCLLINSGSFVWPYAWAKYCLGWAGLFLAPGNAPPPCTHEVHQRIVAILLFNAWIKFETSLFHSYELQIRWFFFQYSYKINFYDFECLYHVVK